MGIGRADADEFKAGQYEVGEFDEGEELQYSHFGMPMVFPLQMKLQSEGDDAWWSFPLEPLISVAGGNVLVKRTVAKKETRGTIKERWAQDDYRITITGLLTSFDSELRYPEADVKEVILKFCEAREPIDVLCPLFETLGINRLVIESYDLPFTKGIENQAYRIEALSDDDWELLVEMEN